MTYNEFGLRLRKIYPKLNDVPLNDEDLAHYFLKQYPAYLNCISETARKINDIAERPRVSQALFEGWRIEHEARMIQNDAAEVQFLSTVPAYMEASAKRQTLAMLEQEHAANLQIKLENHRTELKLKEYWETAKLDLDAADRSELKAHYQLNYLRNQLRGLYERREELLAKRNRAAKDELKLVNQHIKMLEDDFNARRQTLVSAPDGQGLLEADSDSESSGSSSEAPEAAKNSVSASAKSRVGF